MRTTVDIPDALYGKLKSHAAERGTSVKQLLLRGAEAVLGRDEAPRVRTIQLPLIKGRGGRKVRLTNADIEKALSS
jgi:hypothetical protein